MSFAPATAHSRTTATSAAAAPRGLRWCAAIAIAAIALVAAVCLRNAAPTAADAIAPPPALLAADATQPGIIKLQAWAATGTQIVFNERVGDRLERLGGATIDVGTSVVLPYAATWRCDRLVRKFVATATLPDQTVFDAPFNIHTRSCAQRFRLRAPRRVADGAVARVRIVDTWGIGSLNPSLCVTPPHGGRTCKTASFAPAVTIVSSRFRAATRGLWKVQLLVRGHAVSTTVAVGGAAGAGKPVPTVLAVGDSTMQGIDSFLSDELGNLANVDSDVRPGTGISHPLLGSTPDEWTALATDQAKRLAPTATVVSIGAAADGFPMTTPAGDSVQCCDDPWVTEYARRITMMMRSYRRHGHGRVLWLTQPTPRGAPRKLINDAVNAAILRAGADMSNVTILRMDQLFTPDGYSDYIRYQGRQLRVRADDGVHLNVAGTAIAAKLVARVLRKPPFALAGGD